MTKSKQGGTTADRARSSSRPPSDARLTPTLTLVHHPRREALGTQRALGSTPVELGRESSFFGAGVLDHKQISRQHLRVVPEGFTLSIEDTGSRNGTLLNGRPVRAAYAEPGDVLEIGPLLLLYHLAPREPAALNHPRLVGQSAGLARVVEEVERVAQQGSTVLLLGETGTGKELVARELHLASGRAGQLVAANCGSLTDNLLQSELFGYERGAFSGAVGAKVGLFEAASQGTLLLDEIGDASLALQVSLLRVLQEREVRRLGATASKRVDVRVIAATHRDLSQLVGATSFREDLYARLSQWVLRIPPLRERREDIPLLVASMLEKLGEKRLLHRSAMTTILRAPLPRNVRQLQAAVERIVLSAPKDEAELRLDDASRDCLAPLVGAAATGSATLAAVAQPAWGSVPMTAPDVHLGATRAREAKQDREGLVRLFKAHGGNVTHVARELQVGRNTLYRWLRDASLSVESLRGDGD